MPLRRRSCQWIPPGSQYVEALYDVQGITKSRGLITVSRLRQTRRRQAAPSTPNGWERLPCGLRIKFERPGMVPRTGHCGQNGRAPGPVPPGRRIDPGDVLLAFRCRERPANASPGAYPLVSAGADPPCCCLRTACAAPSRVPPAAERQNHGCCPVRRSSVWSGVTQTVAAGCLRAGRAPRSPGNGGGRQESGWM